MNFDGLNFRVEKFSFFSCEDPYDLRFGHEICWSRVYEYPFVLGELSAMHNKSMLVHNASWGFRDIHLVFKTWLDAFYGNTIHTDIKPSSLWNTAVWDISTPPSEAYQKKFDAIINVSTLEEVNANHVQLIKNHLVQLKLGGLLVLTFEVPGLQLDEVENFLEQKIITPPKILNPKNSILEDKVLNLPNDFKVGYLVIKRIEF